MAPTPAPVLVLAAHGSQRHSGAADHVARVGDAVRARCQFSAVRSVFQMGGPDAASLQGLSADGGVVVVPYMMTDGFLAASLTNAAATAIRAETPEAVVSVASAVGTHPWIADAAQDLAAEALSRSGISPAEGHVLIVAHGSRSHPASRQAAESQISLILAAGRFASVHLGLLEEPPYAQEVLAAMPRPAVVVGLFAAPGGHALDDIDEIVNAPGVIDVIDAGFVGQDPRMAEIVADRATAALGGSRS